MGGGGDLAAKLEHLVVKKGETRDQAGDKVFSSRGAIEATRC